MSARAFVEAVIVVALASCAGSLAGPAAVPRAEPRQCATDADCSPSRGEICRAADGSGTPDASGHGGDRFQGICVIPAQATTREVFLEIHPASDAVPPAQLGPIELAAGQNQTLTLPAPKTVRGSVLDHRTEAPVGQAKVRFKLTPLIADRPMTFDAPTDADAGSQTVGTFSRLLPDGEFSVTLVPPPSPGAVKAPNERPFGDGEEPLDLLAEVPQTFALSSPSELVAFAGTATVLQDGAVVPAADVEVWAMDAGTVPAALTGIGALVGRTLAQPVTTDALGRFTLWPPRLAPGQTAHQVRLQFGPVAGGAPFPSFVDPTVYTVDDGGVSPATPPPSARIDSPVEVTGQVQVLRRDRLVGLANARVTFRTTDDSPFSFSTTVVTGDDGSYDALLFPATYQPLAAMPPPDGLEDGVPVGDCPADRDPDKPFVVSAGAPTTRGFLCAAAAPLAGETRNGDDAVPFVAVEAVRHKDAVISDDLHLRTESDASGVFALWVPAGDYDLVLVPPASTKLPQTVDHVGEVDADEQQSRLVIELDPPFDLFGQLFSGDKSHPLAGTIEAYTVGADGTSRLVGQTASGEDGVYTLILPASGG